MQIAVKLCNALVLGWSFCCDILFGGKYRQAGGLEGYPYSKALQTSDIVWSAATINRLFEEGPDKVTPGTKMPIQRMKSAKDREDLVSFLQSATQK